MAKQQNKSIISLGSVGGSNKLSFLSIFIFFILWIILSSSKLVNPLILPSPFRVLIAFSDVGLKYILHILFTAGRIIIGLFLGSFLGMTLGILMQYYRNAFILLDGLIETFRPIPPVALMPFIILIFGFSEAGKIIIVTLGVALVIVVDTIEAIERVPIGVLRWGLISGISRSSLFRRIIIPSAWPEMRGGFRIALALSFTLVIVSEFMGAKYGLGYLINVSKITLTTPTILASIIILGWLGWVLDKIMRLIFEKTCFWDIRAKGATR